MVTPQYQIDAFANKAFEGNPAAVCPLDEWLSDDLMQTIAAENNLAETAFFVENDSGFEIRWFTPSVEVDLCGHATLASAYVLFNELGYQGSEVIFSSKSGDLTVTRHDELFSMDFPAEIPRACDTPADIARALGLANENCIEQCLFNQDIVLILDSETAVNDAKPDFKALMKFDSRGIIVSAQSEQYDFVNRFFGPNVGIDEDPVTGSAFTKLVPYWSGALGKQSLIAKQVSVRGGEVFCEYNGERVEIAGYATLFLKGHIHI